MQCIHIPKILREGCVLQRGSHTRVWGWSDAPVKGLLKNSYGLLTAPLCVDLS